MKHKCLKEGWLPYHEAFPKYIKAGDVKRFINKVPDKYKEKISRIWFVDTNWFEAYANGNVKLEYVIKED